MNYTFSIYSTYPRSEDLYTLTNVQVENIVKDIVNSVVLDAVFDLVSRNHGFW